MQPIITSKAINMAPIYFIIQLLYLVECTQRGLNSRPLACKANALPAELCVHIKLRSRTRTYNVHYPFTINKSVHYLYHLVICLTLHPFGYCRFAYSRHTKFVDRMGLEPITLCLQSTCSRQLELTAHIIAIYLSITILLQLE